MEIAKFLAGAILISLSGVMAPGPLTAAVVGSGNRDSRAGILIAAGHAVIEFPLMFLLFAGFGYLLKLPYVQEGIGIAGGLFLLYMAVGMFLSIRGPDNDMAATGRTPFAAGLLLSVGNPYFIIWWATVGATLLFQAAEFGYGVLFLFMLLHWTADLLWYYFLSALSFRGIHFFGNNFQKVIFGFCGIFLLFFAGSFIYTAVKNLL